MGSCSQWISLKISLESGVSEEGNACGVLFFHVFLELLDWNGSFFHWKKIIVMGYSYIHNPVGSANEG